MSANSLTGILEQLGRNRAAYGAVTAAGRSGPPLRARENPAPVRPSLAETVQTTADTVRAEGPAAIIRTAEPEPSSAFSLTRPPVWTDAPETTSAIPAREGFPTSLRYPDIDTAASVPDIPAAGDIAEAVMEKLESGARLKPQVITDNWE